MDRKVMLSMTVIIVMFLIAAVALTMDNAEKEKEKKGDYASELSENGGWISTSHYHIYVNSDYRVQKGTEVYQDELGIWVHTTQDGKPIYHLFQWSEIKAIMVGEGQ